MMYDHKYRVGDIVLVDPNTEFKFAGKLVKIKRVRPNKYSCTYDVHLPHDEWSTSNYSEKYLISVEVNINKQEDNKMELFKKTVMAQEVGGSRLYRLALYDYDNATTEDLQSKLIVGQIISRGLVLLEVKSVCDNADYTARVAGEVVSVVDTTAYDARVVNREKKAELRKKMDAIIASKSEMQTYQKYAELFPDVAELFNEYKEL